MYSIEGGSINSLCEDEKDVLVATADSEISRVPVGVFSWGSDVESVSTNAFFFKIIPNYCAYSYKT